MPVVFVCLLFTSVTANSDVHAGSCRLSGKAENVAWDYVVDGDTLWLKDGRKIRFAAINTPEIAHENKTSEPFGDEAHRALKQLLADQPRILLQTSGLDLHGRTLGHIFLSDGRSVDELLLKRGLAFQLFSEKYDRYRDCLREAELAARQVERGVWSKRQIRDINKDRLKPGFQLLQGEIESVAKPGKSDFVWLDMKGPVVIRIPKDNLDAAWLKSLRGKSVEVRGWLVERKNRKQGNKKFKRWIVGVYHPDAILLRNE